MFNWSSFIRHLTKSLLGRFYELQIDQVSEPRQNTHFPSSSYLTKCLGVCDSSECVKVGFWSWIWKFMHLNIFLISKGNALWWVLLICIYIIIFRICSCWFRVLSKFIYVKGSSVLSKIIFPKDVMIGLYFFRDIWYTSFFENAA